MGKINSCCTSRNQSSSLYNTLVFTDTPTSYHQASEEHKEPYFPIPTELVNSYESKANFQFNFQTIKRLISDAEQSLDGFDHIISKKEYSVYLRPGSPYNSHCPEQKLFIFFDCALYSQEDILYLISNLPIQAQWNSQCQKMSLVQKQSDILTVIHEVVVAPFPHVPRDFVIKVIRFRDQDTYYCYYTSTPDEVKPAQLTKGKFSYIRGQLILGLQVLRKVKNDWRLFTATQRDMKLEELNYKAYEIYIHQLMKLYQRELRTAIHQYQAYQASKTPR